MSAIHEFYRGNSGIEFEDFLRALRSGYFILILDGFDEISPQHRNVFEKEIMHIAREFEKLPLIISGRHDERFNSWEPFNHFSLKSMTHAQTRLLIKKSNYDQEVKTVFLDRLTEDFFDQHQSFLENPLLAIMMMLTFEGYAEIPESLHEFYRIAFDTLMRRHDALKGQFLRESHSSCSTEQFKQLFSSFSLLTYSKSAFSFDRDRALLFIKAAITQQGLEKDESLVLTDLIESICLLQQEGFEVSFVHRSFQEYFSAVFISSSASGFVKKYLDEADFQTFDNVLPMLMGIAQQRVESEWAVDKVAELCGRFPETGSDSESELLVAAFPEFDFMIVNAGAVLTRIQQTKLARELRILETLYPDRFQIEDAEEEEERTLDYYVSHRWERRIADALVEMEDAGCDQLNGVGKAISTVHEKSDGGDRVKFKVLTDKMSGPLFDAVFGSRNRDYVGSLHRIASLQQDRRSRSDRFLGEVFGPIDV